MPEVNFTEKELEDYLCSNGNLKKHLGLRLLRRQYATPAGIIDILAYDPKQKLFVIIELKKDTLDYNAFFQIDRYYHYFEYLANNVYYRPIYIDNEKGDVVDEISRQPKIAKLLIGRNLSTLLNFSVYSYKSHLFLDKTNYTCFDYDFDRGIAFNYASTEQRKVEIGELYE